MERILKVDFDELGSTGLKRNRGEIREEFLRELQGRRGISVYREMSQNDPIIGGLIWAFKSFMSRAEWRVEGEDDELVEFVESCMEDMNVPWNAFLSEALSMLVYGWAYHEIVYKRRKGRQKEQSKSSQFSDGRIGWRKLPIRAQETIEEWLFDEEGGIQGVVQRDPSTRVTVEIPIERSLLFRTTAEKGNPEGRSLLRTSYVPWYRKKQIEMIESIGIERDLAGFPVAWVPPEILATGAAAEFSAVKSSIKTLMANIRRDEQEYLMWPLDYDEQGNKRWDFTLVSSPGSRQLDISGVIKRYDQAIMTSVMADVMLMGQDQVGSFALSKTKFDLLLLGMESVLKAIESVMNRIAIPRLMAVNGWSNREYPQFCVGSLDRADFREIGNYLTQLATAGMPLFPDAELENWLRGVGNMPERPEEWPDELLPEAAPVDETPPEAEDELDEAESEGEDSFES